MATNAIEIEHGLEEAVLRPRRVDSESNGAPAPAIEKGQNLGAGNDELRPHGLGILKDAAQELALAPLVDNVAYGLASVLVVAIRGLENHIASETHKVSDTVGRRLDALQAGFQELTAAISEQRSMNLSVQDQCHQLAATAASLQESQARQDEELAAIRKETGEFSASVSERLEVIFRELGVHQEDIAAVKSTLSGLYSRVDGIVERLDKQAAALRSMSATYAHRETELEQLVDGLARLRAYPAPAPTNGL
jgi:septal ring factor EnvC (AmiA/AmiB activator)